MSATPEQYDVIRRPIITEKATMASEAGAVVFEVAMHHLSHVDHCYHSHHDQNHIQHHRLH